MQWQVRWSGVVSQVRPDPLTARERLKTGHKHLVEAEELLARGLSDLALLLAEAALVNGADAMLLLHGFAVSNHAARLTYPLHPPPYSHNAGLLQRIRSVRNASLYEAPDLVSPQLARTAVALARVALKAVRALTP